MFLHTFMYLNVYVCVCICVWVCIGVCVYHMQRLIWICPLDSVCRSGSCGKSSENAYEIRMWLRARLRMHKHSLRPSVSASVWVRVMATWIGTIEMHDLLRSDPVPGWGSSNQLLPQLQCGSSFFGGNLGATRGKLGCPFGCKHLQECSRSRQACINCPAPHVHWEKPVWVGLQQVAAAAYTHYNQCADLWHALWHAARV